MTSNRLAIYLSLALYVIICGMALYAIQWISSVETGSYEALANNAQADIAALQANR